MEQSLEQGKKSVTDLFIRHFGFWPQLSDRERELLNTHTHAVRYKRGTQVHRGPFDCIGVMLIKRGQLRVYTLSEDGRDVTIYRLFADDIGILSAACTLDAVTFDVYIDAEEDTEVLLTDASAFRKLSEGNIYVRCPRGRHPPDQVLQSGGMDYVGPRVSAHRGLRGTQASRWRLLRC